MFNIGDHFDHLIAKVSRSNRMRTDYIIGPSTEEI